MRGLFDLFLTIVEEEREVRQITLKKIKERIQFILDKYSNKGLLESDAVNFADVEYRCAYLYLYATNHCYMIGETLCQFSNAFLPSYFSWMADIREDEMLNVCSIGAGPGSDVIGLLLFLHSRVLIHSGMRMNCILIDKYCEWESTFVRIMNTLWNAEMISHNLDISTRYLGEDMFGILSSNVIDAIQNAHLVTMTKFVSAVSSNENCKDLLKKVFCLMKPGGLVLYIDNSGGHSYKRMLAATKAAGFENAFGPLRHIDFKLNHLLEPTMDNMDQFKLEYGVYPQTGSKITVAIWKKPVSSLSILNTPPRLHRENVYTVMCGRFQTRRRPLLHVCNESSSILYHQADTSYNSPRNDYFLYGRSPLIERYNINAPQCYSTPFNKYDYFRRPCFEFDQEMFTANSSNVSPFIFTGNTPVNNCTPAWADTPSYRSPRFRSLPYSYEDSQYVDDSIDGEILRSRKRRLLSSYSFLVDSPPSKRRCLYF